MSTPKFSLDYLRALTAPELAISHSKYKRVTDFAWAKTSDHLSVDEQLHARGCMDALDIAELADELNLDDDLVLVQL
jgi:predicted outer membrane protein